MVRRAYHGGYGASVTRGSMPSDADLEVLENLARLSFLVQARLVQVAEAQHLTPVQARLLVVLSDREPTMLVLAGIMGLEKSSLTGLVDRAEARGLVERFADPQSRRSVRVRLTAAGRRKCRAYVAAAAPELIELLEALPAGDRKRLGALAGRVVHGYVANHGIDVSTLDAPLRFV